MSTYVERDFERFNRMFADLGAIVTDEQGEPIGIDPSRVPDDALKVYHGLCVYAAATGMLP